MTPQSLPIKRNIMAVIMLTSLTVLALTVASFIAYDLTTFRDTMVQPLATLARVVAANSTAALAFKNQKDAAEILSSLRTEPEIIAAALYDGQGKIFVTYTNSATLAQIPPVPEEWGHRFADRQLVLFQPVSQGGTRLGTLFLKADLRSFYRRLEVYSAVTALIVLGMIIVALALSNRLQKRISDPILALAGAARRVSEWRDYSVRAPKSSGDELGVLTDAFNQMLTQIEEQTLALQAGESRLRLALEASRTGAWDWNLKTNRMTWDDFLHSLHGLKPGEFAGSYEDFLKLVYPADRPILERAVREAREGRTHFHCEHRVEWPDGSLHYLSARGKAFYDANGEAVQMSGVAQDITDRRHSEEARRRLAAIVESSDDAIISKDLNGIITSWNKGAERHFGYTAVEAVGRPITITIPPDRPDEETEILERVRRGERIEHYETVRRRKDGSLFDVSLTVSPMKDAEGRIVGASSISRDVTERRRYHEALENQARILREQAQMLDTDITERKLAEEQMLRMNAELERRVQERTAELTVANQELEAFTYSVAHDLRAPLRHVDAFSKIIFDDFSAELPADVRRYLENIRKGSQNMSRLVDDLLNLARVGRQELKRELIPLAPLVNEVISDLKGETQNRRIEWSIGPLPTVESDPGLMKQIFANLLSNAVKYTRPRKKALIEIGQRQIDHQTVIYVRDNGVGFSMKYADKLFGVFQRLHRADEFEGTGVGLATVDRLVRKHGGRIWAEAETDKGATFYFTLNGLNPSAKPG